MIKTRDLTKGRDLPVSRHLVKSRDLSINLIGLYIGYIDNASTSAVISFQTRTRVNNFKYKKQGESGWTVSNFTNDTPLGINRYHYNAYLSGLDEDTIYEVSVDGEINEFKTMPINLDGKEVKIMMTSDVSYGGTTHETDLNTGTPLRDHLRVIKHLNPDAVVIAGDVGHASTTNPSKSTTIPRWEGFWDNWLPLNKNNEGHVLPIIVCYGNHEMEIYQNGYFKKFFPQIEGDYGAVDIGNYLTFLALNTNHTAQIPDQVPFVEQQLSDKSDRLVVPLMHVSPYQFGQFRSNDEEWSKQGRELLTPIYTQHDNVKFAFSGHSHTYGYTPKVTGDSLDPDGKIYIGQGGLGIDPRAPVSSSEWFVDKVDRKNHVWLLTLTSSKAKMESYDLDGNMIDELQWIL